MPGVYSKYLEPKSHDEDVARREYTFNVLLAGLLALTFAAFLITLLRQISQGSAYHDSSPYIHLSALTFLLILYAFSRNRFSHWIVYIFVALYLILGTYALLLYGYALPTGLLTYVLAIIISGILISARASLGMTFLICITLGVLATLQGNGVMHPSTSGLDEPLSTSNVAVYMLMFLIIFSVSWLSNREIEKSLRRARRSEELVRKERNRLEVKVIERTRELERAQVEKNLELYRFAEFGRLSSSLLHDLANPLTAVSLNLDQLKGPKGSKLMTQIKEGINSMEQYVHSARRQLRSQSESKVFDCKPEIERVVSFLSSKAQSNNIKVRAQLVSNAYLQGDGSKFNQVMANLLANAIDAYIGSARRTSYRVTITSKVSTYDNTIRISVHDRGRGISSGEMKRIFDPFFTTKSSERGTGIGLTITKRIVEEDFNGEIIVKSSKKNGTTFALNLPLYTNTDSISADE
jgi:signal transduction histidine kinase